MPLFEHSQFAPPVDVTLGHVLGASPYTRILARQTRSPMPGALSCGIAR